MTEVEGPDGRRPESADPSGTPMTGGQPSFEERFRELEETVRKLEQGDLDLETSLALFERGIQLARRCEEMLDQAELKVHELMPDLTPSEEPRPPQPG